MTLREYNREVRRRHGRMWLRAVGELVMAVAVAVLAVLVIGALVIATPDQMSAEFDWAQAQTEWRPK